MVKGFFKHLRYKIQAFSLGFREAKLILTSVVDNTEAQRMYGASTCQISRMAYEYGRSLGKVLSWKR